MRAGADDYLTKPFEMRDFLERIVPLCGSQRATADRRSTLALSAPMRRVENLLRRVADVDSSVLFTAKAASARRWPRASCINAHCVRAPLRRRQLRGDTGELLESELFGHERGAFTGAHKKHRGYAERARDGILFLDEIGDLPPPSRRSSCAVHDRTFERLGGEKPIV